MAEKKGVAGGGIGLVDAGDEGVEVGEVLILAGLLLDAVERIAQGGIVRVVVAVRGFADALDQFVERAFFIEVVAIEEILVHLFDHRGHALIGTVAIQGNEVRVARLVTGLAPTIEGEQRAQVG